MRSGRGGAMIFVPVVFYVEKVEHLSDFIEFFINL